MPSQRHLIYLLPRADPEELQDGGLTLPCTCSYPLQLRIRIPPPNPSASTSSYKSDTPLARNSDRGQSSFAFAPSSSSPSSSQPLSPASPARLSSSSSSSISSSRASKTQIATWKLLAPQMKTISSTSNIYLLSEAFPGITSASLQQSADVQRRERERSYSLASMVEELKLDTPSLAADAALSPTFPPTASHTPPRAAGFASTSAGPSAPTTSLSTIQETNQSEEARRTPTHLHPIITSLSTPIQPAFSSSTISSLPTISLAGSLNGTRKVPTAYRKELESVLFAQTASSSSSSPSSASNRNSIGASGYSVIPTLTSSIFSLNSANKLQYPHSSDTSSSASSSRPSSTTTSPASSLGNASISSIPFLDDAPTLKSKPKSRHGGRDDHFDIDGSNSNVVHVNDLGWYLEKVLWKLGLHRKGRKEFMTYWLARFANDDYVALRFLKQDEIETFAPVEISVASPLTSTTTPTCKDSMSPASSLTSPISSSSSSHPASSWPIERHRSSEHSAVSNSTSSTIAHETDDRNTCSSVSSRGTSNSNNTSSEPSTPPSEAEDNNSNSSSPIFPEQPYSFHRIHVVFQRLDKQDIALFQYRVKYRSGSSTLGVIDWNEIDGIVPSEESKREDRPRVLHLSATDLGRRGLYFTL